jgi:hypothetical protein
MQQRGFSVTGSIIFASGVALGLAALGSNTSLSQATDIRTASSPFPASVDKHKTPMESQTSHRFPSVSEIPTRAEIEVPAPTRSSFMAS